MAPKHECLQSYLMHPKEDCMDKDFEMFMPLKNLDRNEKIH